MFSFSKLSLLILIITSSVIMYQDFKQRLVSLWVLILFGFVCIASVIINRDAETLITNSVSITIYLVFIWGTLKLYLYLKRKQWVTIINEQLGMADVVVILSIGITCNVIGQVLFFCTGFIFSLLAFLIYSSITKTANQNAIPLAGLLVFYYLAFIFFLAVKPFNIIDCSFIAL